MNADSNCMYFCTAGKDLPTELKYDLGRNDHDD